uniref:Major facilitator superfamily (MFS) profile domain-containing protein n=1 Tax=Plectus sambesii TaxID=2011161 RepID=A0A914WCE1_9BILA
MVAQIGYREVTALMGAFFARLITCGSVYSWGIFYDPFQASFKLSNLQTSALFALVQGFTQSAGLIAPWLLKRLSIRQVVIIGGTLASVSTVASSFAGNYWAFMALFGLLQGIGHGMVYVTVPIAASFILPERHSHIAISLHNSGDGFGLLLFPLLIEVLLELFAWRQAILLIAVIQAHCVLCGLLLKDNYSSAVKKQPSEAKEMEETEQGSQTWRKTNIALLVASSLLDSLAFSAYYTFIFPHLERHTATPAAATVILSVTGAVSIIGRLSVSLFDEKCIPRWLSFAFAHLAQGLAIFAIVSLPPSMEVFLICAAVLGLGAGIGGALLCCVCKDVCGGRSLTDVFSYSMFAWGIGSAAAPPTAGLLQDLTGSSTLPLAVGGAAFTASAGLLLLFFFTVDRDVACLSKKTRVIDSCCIPQSEDQSVTENLISLPKDSV